jgi:hypothetical protein
MDIGKWIYKPQMASEVPGFKSLETMQLNFNKNVY